MLNFEFTDEQKEIQNAARRFALEEIRPVCGELDEQAKFPKDLLEKAWSLGFMNTCIPEEYGGIGFGATESTLIGETLAYGCMGIYTSLMCNDLALLPIVLSSNTEAKERFLRPFTESFKLASFCLTEPNHGSNAGGIQTRFKEDGDEWVITGDKMWITNAGHADLFVVFGTVDPELRYKGIVCGVVEKGAAGLEIGIPEKKMGHKASDTRALRFENVRIPKENMIALPGEGWTLAMKTLDHSRPMVASNSVGGAQAALEHSLKYASERKQFGVNLSAHQNIQTMLADMKIKVEASRNFVQRAAWLLDQHKPNTLEASMAKAYAADACMDVATQAVQIFGGYGYSKEYPVEKIMRDAKLIQIYEGTSQIQRMVIAREILKNS